jgi:hypothetical protein
MRKNAYIEKSMERAKKSVCKMLKICFPKTIINQCYYIIIRGNYVILI